MSTIAICIPSGDRWHAGFALDVAKLVGYTHASDPTAAVAILNVRGSILPQLRATLTKQALAIGADWLFWLDSDMRFPKDALLQLLAREKSIVGCNYATRQPPIKTGASKNLETVYTRADDTGLVEVDRMGFGCVLVHQSVFARMERPWFAFGYSRPDDDYLGEDYFWFQKAKAMGELVWLDHDLSQQIFHLGEVPFSNAHAVAAQAEEFVGESR